MKTLIVTLLGLALTTGCASVHIEFSEYTPKPEYCADGYRGEALPRLSSPSMTALDVSGAVVYVQTDNLAQCARP